MMHDLTFDALVDTLAQYDPEGLAEAFAAELESWAQTIANEAVRYGDIRKQLTFLAEISGDELADAERSLEKIAAQSSAGESFRSYADHMVWAIVYNDILATFSDPEMMETILSRVIYNPDAH